MVGFTYGEYPRGGIFIAGNYRGYLRRPYIRIYPGGTVSVGGNESFVSRRGYIGYNVYMGTYRCGTVVGRRHPYTGIYNVGTVGSSRLNETRVSPSGYISYNVYLIGYPFNTVVSGDRVCRAVATLGDSAPICTTVTPTFTNRFNGIDAKGVHATFGRLKFRSIIRITVNTSLYAVRRTRSFVGRIPRGRPFVTASYYPT